MGGEVSKTHFVDKDYALFQQKLDQEMQFVRDLFQQQAFDNQTRRLGYELELCLLNEEGNPCPMNQQVLDKTANPLFTYELAKYNLEINGNAFALSPDVFKLIEQDLSTLYDEVATAAKSYGCEPGLFGVLPSLNWDYLDASRYMSNMYRYQVLNDRLMSMRDRPINMDIQGLDHLHKNKNDVMFEAMGTSLQVHMQIPFDDSVNCYHASLWASMAVLAVSANSPLVLGKRCWQESRIPIFKQSVDTRNAQEVHDAIIPRVHLGKKYIKSWLELFEDNDYYSPILPEVTDSDPAQLNHFNLHNGTIWRWVRPIIGVNNQGEYHLRLELRVAPSGPTQIDTMANMVFFIGLIEGLKQNPEDLTRIPFNVLEQDFYQVGRNGMDAKVNWCQGEKDNMQALLQRHIIPLAVQGLEQLGIQDAEQWMDIIKQRVEKKSTGARWILAFWEKNADSSALVKSYQSHAQQNIPVHLWPKP